MQKIIRTLRYVGIALALALMLGGTFPEYSYATPRVSQVAPIRARDLAAKIDRACGLGFFNAMRNLFGILDDINGVLRELENLINTNLNGFDPSRFDPLSCVGVPGLPGLPTLPNFQNILNCLGGVNPGIPRCELPDFDQISGNIQHQAADCLRDLNMNNYTPPHIDPEQYGRDMANQIAQCLANQASIFDPRNLPDLMRTFDNLVDRITARLNSLQNLLSPRNLEFANWFNGFCGIRGQYNINVTRRRGARR